VVEKLTSHCNDRQIWSRIQAEIAENPAVPAATRKEFKALSGEPARQIAHHSFGAVGLQQNLLHGWLFSKYSAKDIRRPDGAQRVGDGYDLHGGD
jgi:hypothetical protein